MIRWKRRERRPVVVVVVARRSTLQKSVCALLSPRKAD